MESKRKKSGLPIMLIGVVVLGQHLTRMHYDRIKITDIIIIVCCLVFISIGIYANFKNPKKND